MQGLSQLAVPTEFDGTGCISHGGAARAPAQSSKGITRGGGSSSSSFVNASFTWPPGASEPSESASGPPAGGAFAGINPLANAIDLPRTTRTVSQEAVPSAAAAGARWNVVQQAIKNNMQELRAIVADGAGSGSGSGRAYARMTPDAQAEAAAAQGAGPEAVSRVSDSSSEG